MVSSCTTIAFQGIKAVPVDVQVMIGPGKVSMQIVGLADKAVTESRERVQSALHASGLSMPGKRVTVNLAPADLPKEGSHYDLPIALALMVAMGAIPADALDNFVVMGELGLRFSRHGHRSLASCHWSQFPEQGIDLPVYLRI